MTTQKIISEIVEYVKNCGGNYSDWYAGIASTPRNRLFDDHKVDEKNGNCIYQDAGSSDIARKIENYLINELGMDGDTGGGDDSTKYIYAYKKTLNTVE